MSTLSQAVTGVPTALAGTADDTFYSLQNRTEVEMLFAVADAVPAATTGSAFGLGRLKDANTKHAAGGSIWVWSNRGNTVVAYEEAG